jgi:titin
LAALAGNARVDLTWSAPVSDGGSSITNYSIYRGLSSGGEVFLTLIGNITAYTDLGLTNGVTYYYTVGAVNGVGESAQSNEASAIPATVPTPPWSLLASAASAQVTLTWFAPASDGGLTITNYRVYRGLSPGAEIFLVEIGALLTHVDVGLVNGQEYCYAVSAVNPIGEGSQSTESCATPTAGPTIPTAPQGLAAFGGNAQVVLTWAAPASDGGSAITNYRVHRSATSSTETFLAEIGNLLTYTDATVTNGLTYYYFVTARNGVGEGPASTEANATPTAAANLPPTCTITAPVPDETISSVYVIRGIATDSDGVVQYVEVRIDGGAWTQATPGATWSLAVNTTALAEGQHTIRARSFDGTSYSSEASVTVAVRNVSPPPGDSIFEQRWYWAALLIAIISAVLFLLLFLSRRRKEKEEEVVPVPADGPQGGEGPIGEMPPPEGPEPLLEQDENPLE